MNMLKKPLIAAISAAIFVSLPILSRAQVEVVESNNRLLASPQSSDLQAPTAVPGAAVPRAVASSPSANNSADLFFQLQTLQQEVQELRGLMEEQAYELKRLKQQRLDDYVNLDQRLSGLSKGGANPTPAPAAASGNTSAAAAAQTTAQAPDEMQRYRTAIDLVLRKKDYAQAIVAFNQYLRDFPQGRYAPNCQYWLGEIYLLQNELEQAREWFTRLTTDFPDHGKAPDANFKLGTVYHKLGDTDQAKSILSAVAAGDSNASRLATSYLSENL
ncbi:MAG: tol-pal system protein YbgF [Cellvibrionaceae bacterium]